MTNYKFKKFTVRLQKIEIMNILSQPDSVIFLLNKTGRYEISKYYAELINGSPKSKEIPKFFISDLQSSKNNYHYTFSSLLISLATNHSFQSIINSYPSYQDIQDLHDAYEKMPKNTPPRVIKYSQYKQLRQQWPESLQPILSSRLFIEIGGHSTHTINADEFFKRLDVIPCCVEHFIRLNQYDLLKTGSIDEKSFIEYVTDMSNNLSFIEQQSKNYPDFHQRFIDYVSTAIFTFLDPIRTGKILINELIRNNFYLDFVMLESLADNMEDNHFSPMTTMKYINEFNQIDHDGDGFLSQEDLYSIPNTRFTKAFVDRVFEVTTTNISTNFSWYIRFRLMWDMPDTKWANQIMFDIFDVDGDGKITFFEINYFYREIKNISDLQFPPLDSWMNEMFDHYGVTDSCITKKMFIDSFMSHSLRQLVDACTFISSEFPEEK